MRQHHLGAIRRELRAQTVWGLLVTGALLSLSQCTGETEIGRDMLRSTDGGQAGEAGAPSPSTGGHAGSGGGGTAYVCSVATCGNRIFACGDCLDNEGDGLIDALDPECLGPCDATEESLSGGPHTQVTGDCRSDCYFDRNSGAGGDRCNWSQRCDPLGVAPDYAPSGSASCAYEPATSIQGQTCADLQLSQPSECLERCLPLTPNGCDCFGCCELPARSGRYVWVGSLLDGLESCDNQSVADPERCRPCTPVRSCLNPCESCEVCVGGAAPEPSCGGTAVCDEVLRPCGSDGSCPAGDYCITGCCVAVPR